MKEKGINGAEYPIDDEDFSEEEIRKALPKSDHIKEHPLIKLLKPLLSKATEEDLKIYSYAAGTKSAKVQFRQFPSVEAGLHQIFDVTGIFRSHAQLDAVCHTIGFLILQFLFIVRVGIKLTAFTKKFLERESIRNFRGQLAVLQTDVKESFDLFNKRLISKKEFEDDMLDFIEGFSTEEQKKIAAKFIDDIIESGEEERSRKRLSMEKSRKYEAMYSGLKQV